MEHPKAPKNIPALNLSREEFESALNLLTDALTVWIKNPDHDSTSTVLDALTKIGRALEEVVSGVAQPRYANVSYQEEANRFQVLLGSGSAGLRLFVNTSSLSNDSYKLIFPNANTTQLSTQKSFASAFAELFGSKAVNIQPESQKPYYVVDLGIDSEDG